MNDAKGWCNNFILVRSATITKKAPGTGRRYRLGFYWQQRRCKGPGKVSEVLMRKISLQKKRSFITLTPADNAMMATMAGNFNDGSYLVEYNGECLVVSRSKIWHGATTANVIKYGFVRQICGYVNRFEKFSSIRGTSISGEYCVIFLAVTSKTECCRTILNGRVS